MMSWLPGFCHQAFLCNCECHPSSCVSNWRVTLIHRETFIAGVKVGATKKKKMCPRRQQFSCKFSYTILKDKRYSEGQFQVSVRPHLTNNTQLTPLWPKCVCFITTSASDSLSIALTYLYSSSATSAASEIISFVKLFQAHLLKQNIPCSIVKSHHVVNLNLAQQRHLPQC